MRLMLTLSLGFVIGTGAARADDLSLRQVMLSSAGVGYFEYQAAVGGPTTLGLDVKLDQVDDVLKSLVVFDDKGSVGAVELPGRDESRTAFGQVPFGPEGLASPLAFLNSLQGIELVVDGPRPMRGRLLRAESVREPSPGPGQEGAVRTRVSLMTDTGLQQFVLEESNAVQVADAGLRARIERALIASRRESAEDVRHLSISSLGDGARTVRVSYVTAAPLWKASYRLLLPPEDADPATATARLQGWATLENVTGSDWQHVGLALQYGNPVTFHQAIYRSYFVTRPEVPVEVLGRLLPDVDPGARAAEGLPPPAAAAMAPMPMMRAARPAGRAASVLADASGGASAQEAATETVFTLAHPIDLAAGHSATVPILDSSVPAARIDLLTPDESHPVAALRLSNNTGSSLPAGVLTLYDTGADAPYAGDARLGGVPAGESRLIAYAQDLRTTAEWRREDQVTLTSVTAAGGVVQLERRNREITHVTLVAPAQAPRHILVEVPKGDEGTIAPGFAQPREQTDSAWRFAVDLKAGETQQLTFAIDRQDVQSIALLGDQRAVAAVLGVQGLSPAARSALEGLARLRSQEAARRTELDRLTAERTSVEGDETRLRANLAALQSGDALRTRLLKQLDGDESRLGQLDTAIAQATDALAQAHGAFADAVATLRL